MWSRKLIPKKMSISCMENTSIFILDVSFNWHIFFSFVFRILSWVYVTHENHHCIKFNFNCWRKCYIFQICRTYYHFRNVSLECCFRSSKNWLCLILFNVPFVAILRYCMHSIRCATRTLDFDQYNHISKWSIVK